MNYIQDIVARLRARLEDCDDELLHHYAVLVMVRGDGTTSRDVHDAWSAWRSLTSPEHQSVAPFDDLTTIVQKLDEPYVAAIRAVSLDIAGTVTPEDVRIEAEAWDVVLDCAESGAEDWVDQEREFDEDTTMRIRDRALDIIRLLRERVDATRASW